MTIKQSQNPYGYRNLLVYKKERELQADCAALTHVFPKTKTLAALAEHGLARLENGRVVKRGRLEGQS